MSPAAHTPSMSTAYTASEARALAAEARATAAEAMATAAEARYTEVVRHTEDSIQSALHPVLQSQTMRQAQHEQAYGEAVARLAAAEERAQREAQWRASKEQEVEAVQRQLRAALEAAGRMQSHFESQVEGLKRRAEDAEERARREYESRAAREGKHSASAAQMRQALEAERNTRAQQDEKREKATAQAAARATAKAAAAEERAHRESVRAQTEADERASCEAQLAAMRLELQRAREASRDAATEHGESRAELLDRVLAAEERVRRGAPRDSNAWASEPMARAVNGACFGSAPAHHAARPPLNPTGLTRSRWRQARLSGVRHGRASMRRRRRRWRRPCKLSAVPPPSRARSTTHW